jgi:hypothetical protein
MRGADHKGQQERCRLRRFRRLQFFRPLVIESFEERQLLTSGLFSVQLDGLPDTSDEERLAAAAARLQAAGLTSNQVAALSVIPPRESILVRTPVAETLGTVIQELVMVPGFIDADDYDPGAANEEADEEEEEDSGEQTVSLTGNEPTIAVNPGNVNNIVIAQAARLRISTDGGATFPTSVSRPLPSGQTSSAGDDSLAFDAQNRLTWSYLTHDSSGGTNVAAVQVNPTTGAIVGSAALIATGDLDKEWIAADHNAASPFANRLYAVWTDFGQSSNAPVRFARSVDQGATWTINAGNLTSSGEGFTWPPEVAVGPNGDVWTAWHANGSSAGSGGVRMRRSTDGGVTFGSELVPFPNGTAAITYNVNAPRISGMVSWLQGSLQPRILVDPTRANTLYVISVDDPDGVYTAAGDPSDIMIARSIDNGATWIRSTVSHGPAGTLQVMPAAAIDSGGNMTVTWYDNRRGLTNAAGNFLLDVYAATSIDGGLTFGNDVRINTTPFDPDLGAPDRFSPNGDLRIGEYNGLASVGGNGYAVWTGNTATGQQTIYTEISTGFQVSNSAPAAGQLVTIPTSDFVIQFTNPVDAASVQASDLTVNGLPADSFIINPAGDAITFHFSTSPVTAEGQQTLAIAGGALSRNADAAANVAYAASFFYDPQPLTVVSTAPTIGGTLPLPAPLTLDVNFSEAIDPATVQTSDLIISGIAGASVSAVSLLNGNTTARFTIGGITREGTLTAVIASGALSDPAGMPLGAVSGVGTTLSAGPAFVGSYQVDVATSSLPGPIADLPLGSLVYETSATGIVNLAGDSDTFTLPLDAGQTVTAVVTSDSQTLQPSVALLNPAATMVGNAIATAVGQNALLQTVTAATSGMYQFVIGGGSGTTGDYTLHVYLNAAAEAADWAIGADSTRQTAQSLDAAFAPLVSGRPSSARAAVVGSMSDEVVLTAMDSGWWNDLGLHTSNNKNYYVGQDTGHIVHDYSVFDLSSIRQPITSAELILSNPSYVSPDSSETFNLYDVSTPVADLEATGSGPSTAVFDDLGSGTILGSTAIDTFNLPAVALNAAGLAYLNAHRGSPLELGGALSSISGASNQWVFGGTDSNSTRQLLVTTTSSDYYSVTLTAGQSLSVALKMLSGSGLNITMQDANGSILALGATGAGGTNLDLAISNFQAATTGVYYLVIIGFNSATYNLVLTRSAAFDREPNDTSVAAELLTAGSAMGDVVAAAPQFVVPSLLATTEGNANQNYPFNMANDGTQTMRYQQLYAASEFNEAGAITAIRFRRNGTAAAFSVTGIDCKVNLGYAATSYATPSSTFADNVGRGTTTVFDGLLSISSNSTTTPRTFDVVITLTRPFFYNPTRGDLLLDMFMRSQTATVVFDSSNSGQQSTTRRVYAQSVTATTGTIDPTFTGLVTRFDMAPVDEDWYSVAISTASPLAVSTATPGDGVSQLNTLNPHIELYDPFGALVVSGAPLADGRNETITYQPQTLGAYRVRVQAEGGTQGEYVLGTGQPPTAGGLTLSTLEDTPLPLALVASDPENDTLSYTITAPPLHGTLSGMAPNLTYTPAKDYFGADSFSYQVSDGQLSSGIATASLTVTPVNDPPVATSDAGMVAEDSAVGLLIDVLANDSPGPANESEQSLLLALGTASHGAVSIESGKVRYIPTEADYNGPDSFTYTITDDGTTGGAADPKTSVGTVNITVPEVNDPPAGVDDDLNIFTFEDANDPLPILTSSLLANDKKGPANESGQTLTIAEVTALTGCIVSLEGPFVVVLLIPDFNGLATFQYTLRDDGTTAGAPDYLTSSANVVAVHVQEQNDAPIANPDAASVVEDSADNTIVVLANDSVGPANENAQALGVIAASALHGTVTVNADSTLSYSPDPDYNGGDTITYEIMDDGTTAGLPDPLTAVGTVDVTVTEVNDAPAGADDALPSIAEDSGPQTIAVAALVANDSKGPANESGQSLMITVISSAIGGTVEIVGTDVVFTPATDYNGPASFVYTLTDDGTTQGQSDPKTSTAAVTFTISPVNDAPSFVKGGDQQVTDEGPVAATTIGFDQGFADIIAPFPFTEDGFTVTALAGQWMEDTTGNWPGNPAPAVECTSPGTLEITRSGSLFSFVGFDLAPAGLLSLVTDSYTVIGLLGGLTIFKQSGQITGQAFLPVGSTSQQFIDTLRISAATVTGPAFFFVDNIRLAVPTQNIDGWATNIATGPPTATDEAGQNVSFQVTYVTDDNQELFIDPPTIDSVGRLRFTPMPNTAGTAHVSVTLMDNGGTADGGVDASEVQTFDIVVTKAHVWQNTINRLDVDANGHVVAADSLAIINFINAFRSQPVPDDGRASGPYVDVNGDGFVAPNDALDVINQINAFGPDGEGEPSTADSDLFLLLALDLSAQAKRRRA